MTKPSSALVIGGGHNGLVCAAYLAKAGVKVTLVEARDELGGMASADGLVHAHHSLSKAVLKDLGVSAMSAGAEIKTTLLSEDGRHMTFAGGDLSGSGATDADKAEFKAFMAEYLSYAGALKTLMTNAPPRLKDMDWTDQKTLGKTAFDLRFGLGRQGMDEFLRIGGMNIYDVLQEKLSSPLLQGGLSAAALFGCHAGPQTPTTMLNMLMRMHQMAAGGEALLCSSVNIIDALISAARTAGANLRTGCPVARVLIEGDRAVGVRLASGEDLRADVVISNADAKTTFLSLVGARELDTIFAHRVRKTRTKGDVARYQAALSARPDIAGCDGSDKFFIAPSLRYVERAFNHSKYGEFSVNPVIDFRVVERGGAVHLSANVMYAPYTLKEGWETGKAAFENRIVEVLSNHVPGIKDLIQNSTLHTPVDIEHKFGVNGGHWHHGEVSIDQGFMMRPVPGTGQYETPVSGLYLCGAAAHPGGDITGLPGRGAAKRILGR